MAPLKLTIRTSLKESLTLEIEDDETAESLAVAIFSLKPELGEELRLAHKGRPLKDDTELREAGVKSGDVIAVAKKVTKPPSPAEGAPAAPVSAATSEPVAASPPAKEAAETPEAPAKDQPEPAASAGAAPAPAAKSAAPVVPVLAAAAGDAAVPAGAAVAAPKVAAPAAVPRAAPTSPSVAPAPVPKDLAHHHAEAIQMPAAEAPAVEAPAATAPAVEAPTVEVEMEGKEVEAAPSQDESKEAPAEAPKEAAAEAPAEEAAAEGAASAPSSPAHQEPEEEISSDTLLAMARRLESGDADAHPGELAAFLRRAATRMQAFESTVGEAGHALQLLNHLSAHALRSMNNSIQGLPQQAQHQEESTKSFLIKKGDADVQEAHRAAAQMRPTTSSGTPNNHSGGVLSASSTPMTKEEMDRARQARLQKLEQQQADKKREQEEAAAKSRACEAMFQKPFVGPQKPLGKF